MDKWTWLDDKRIFFVAQIEIFSEFWWFRLLNE